MKINYTREEVHYKVYLSGLILLAFCLPLSRYLIDIPKYLLILNWAIEGNFRQKVINIRKKPVIILFSTVFILYLVGSVFSDNLKDGYVVIVSTLPLFFLPVIIGSSPQLPSGFIKKLLLIFSASILIASLVCVVLYLFKGLPPGANFRDVSLFKPHIRFTLEINMAIFILFYYSLLQKPFTEELFLFEKPILFTGALALIGSLFFFKSLTGIALFMILSFIIAFRELFRNSQKVLKYVFLVCIIGFTMAICGSIVFIWMNNFVAPHLDAATLEKYTINNNLYSHNTVSGCLENGHYTDIYVCEPELKNEWNRVSILSIDRTDGRGQPLISTLKRYLTSKGLRKDSVAMHMLGPADISNIQKGLANYKFKDNPGFTQRIYETLWEFHVYNSSGYMKDHSLIQRFAFIKIAAALIKGNPLTGVGPGNVSDAMRKQANSRNLEVSPLWNGKPHNQFAFFMLAFGIPGFMWIMFCFVYPVIVNKTSRLLLFNLFIGIMVISMLTLDTLESFDSIMFFAFFYCLFVFASKQPISKKA